MSDDLIVITQKDFKNITCNIDMFGDRIIGYVNKGFIDSLNKLIIERVGVNGIDEKTNLELKVILKKTEKQNQILTKNFEKLTNQVNSFKAHMKKFESDV